MPNTQYSIPASEESALVALQVIRRNGSVVNFEPEKIALALSKAFLAVEGSQSSVSARVRDLVNTLTDTVVRGLTRRMPDGGVVHIEDVQDQVELALMRAGEHDVARAYVLYRERRSAERAAQGEVSTPVTINVRVGEELRPLDIGLIRQICEEACSGLSTTNPLLILDSAMKNLYDGVPASDVKQALILSARTLIETEPDYDRVTARLLQAVLNEEVLGRSVTRKEIDQAYAEYFPLFIERGIKAELLDPRLKEFDLLRIAGALAPERDLQFGYLGMQTLYDRYFLHIDNQRIELPQTFFMRVAMGLAINEVDREERAIEFYNLISSFDFMCSTPTLFNSGTRHPQLSSCYLTTVGDDLDDIFQSVKENALLQKYAGGLGNDWTPVRALGSRIKGTNGESQGVIPFLKVVNDTAVAVNQGGKRKGAVCAYLETWHLDIEEFLDLRKNTGDERRRTHDMNTANWIPDLFMKRVHENADWTLFSPSDVPDLHEKFGREFETAYVGYEKAAEEGRIRLHKKLPAVQLWRKMLTMLFETGHPWITFKDVCNLRSPQQHVGVVHSSNLCTEITLNTSNSETAVCNLGSVNLPAHLKNGVIDHEKLRRTVRTAMRMLDNVVDINFYATVKARNANQRHRPVGMGIMGFVDALYAQGIPYASHEAVEFADVAMEAVCYQAYWASTELSRERGCYSTYKGSLWDQGILPHETVARVGVERAGYLEVDNTVRLDWDALKAQIARYGMRNSNCVAIAPTATISNIVGVSQSIEPTYQNLYVKSNLSGEFVEVNEALVRDLKALDLWDEVMVSDLKYFDGSLTRIERVPENIKARYATAFEIDPVWLVEAASRRQKWIDQAQSLNIYLAQPSGKKLDEIYKLAWVRGLKTTYYLRTLGASQVEKTTGRIEQASEEAPKFCSIDNPDCEACQ
ncbi:ribonucleoside-diphosphate reductase subunit alpha [Fluviibacter phosphoraccumulans]|uniref:Ribonucleoside-diphosphate reductase n=1 Tax=Fluviibacter phosphoraccumulans TaxID=1751046 RepID=A0A455R813_9RHOO|nr:ribonucleoside-diphosphate reductase subunit alpha [Fluviibacter phosphoraccumulans]BBU68871.1 ribonucleoside-diphosphate reductase [Fluviibacter phosphoraccumulans]BBU71977.1 ribonucleoside-diphosphate reductase [Fluviibacter phosphoraccumulans]BCA64777.1 ribonucleoside-diphosphate reductase [Fluviibacter phosphoraccumulans]BCA64964.1 ribonucleoside-diphosphate reductase [Fluviibacter phosphoraccumulans]